LSTGSDDTECGRDTLGEGFLTDVRRALVWHRYHAVSNRINDGGGGGHTLYSPRVHQRSDYITAAVLGVVAGSQMPQDLRFDVTRRSR